MLKGLASVLLCALASSKPHAPLLYKEAPSVFSVLSAHLNITHVLGIFFYLAIVDVEPLCFLKWWLLFLVALLLAGSGDVDRNKMLFSFQ